MVFCFIRFQALNFLAFGTLSPLSSRSAPTFFPLLGHPDFCEQLQNIDTTKMESAAFKNKFLIDINGCLIIWFSWRG